MYVRYNDFFQILDEANKIGPHVDVFLGEQMQDNSMDGPKVMPADIHYGKGEWTQDILIMPHTGLFVICIKTY